MKNMEKEPKNERETKEPESSFSRTVKDMGVKIDLMALGTLELDEVSFELDSASLVNRWKKIFSEAIRKHNISEVELKKLAEEFTEESQKVIEWLKKQPNPSKYTVLHSINPFGNEHIRVEDPHRVERIYRFTMRFEKDNYNLEKDREFREEERK